MKDTSSLTRSYSPSQTPTYPKATPIPDSRQPPTKHHTHQIITLSKSVIQIGFLQITANSQQQHRIDQKALSYESHHKKQANSPQQPQPTPTRNHHSIILPI